MSDASYERNDVGDVSPFDVSDSKKNVRGRFVDTKKNSISVRKRR